MRVVSACHTGKHSNSAARPFARGHLPERQRALLPGETPGKRLGIPMCMDDVA
jgi:hypothetical protein